MIPRPGTYGTSKNTLVFVPFGAVCEAYSIRPYNRVRARVQKMDLYTPPSVAYGGAYAIRPYDRVCAILQNTDAIPQLGTCCPSKNYPVFVSFGAVEWGVFDTPLRLGTCDPSKYRCNSPTGYVLPFKKLSRFRPLRGRRVGVFNTPLRLGTCGPSKNDSVFVPFGAVCEAYAIHPYGWIHAIFRNTDAILQLGMYDSSKYRCDSPTGYVRGFKKWICIRHRRWRMVGRIRYVPTTGYVRPFKIPM